MRKFAAMLICVCLFAVQAMAQSTKLTGKVTDSKDGSPLSGVSITVKGGSAGVKTDNQGNFSITIPSGKQLLVFSFVGYQPKEVSSGNQSTLSVSLISNDNALNDVVVVGYQTIARRNLTGAVSKVDSAPFTDKPILSFDNALTGKAAGVQVNTSSGLVGDNVVIRVRGTATISSGADPLIVLDGIPLVTGNQGQLYNPANALADLNPADIESVEILKDASAAAIYGSRGTNGVILVTTKKGKAGVSKVSYDMYVGAVNPTRKLSVLNGDQYIATINKLRSNAGLSNAAAYGDINGDGVVDVTSTDWQKASFRTGFTQNQQVSFSGGSQKTTYYGSLDYNDFQNYIIVNRQQRGSGRINVNTKVSDFLEIGVNTQFSRNKSYGLGSGTGAALSGFPYGALTSAPDVPIYANTPSGYYLGNGGNTIATGTPNAIAVQNLNHDTRVTNRYIGAVYGVLNLAPGLKFKSQGSVDYQTAFTNQFWSPVVGDGVGNGIAQTVYSEETRLDWFNTLNYAKKVGDHDINVLVGAEYTRAKGLYSYVSGVGLNDPRFLTINGSNYASISAENSSPTGATNNGLASYFGTVNYGFRNKYLATFNIRRDAYSGYGSDNRWGNFPAGSLAWRISEENFMKNVKWVKDLKIRGSYGQTGNSNIGDFPAVASYATAQYADITGLGLSQPGNSTLRWEKTNQTDIGFDATFGKGIAVTVDYYNKKTVDLVFSNPILSTAGLGTSLTQNIGQIQNTGVELGIVAPIINKKDFSWNVNFNIAYNKNKVLKINDNNDNLTSGFGLAQAGYDLGASYLIRWAGVNAANGLPTFLDVNGVQKQYDFSKATASRWTKVSDGTVTTAISSTDRVIDNKKTPYPKFFGGLSQTLRYKSFDLSIDLQYSLGAYLYNSTKTTLMSWSNTRNKSTDILNAWTTAGQNTNVQRLYYGDNFWTANANTRWLEKSDFLRIRNIQIGYTLPQSLMSRYKISRLRFYAQIQNVYTFTGYTGIDPEANANATGAASAQNIGFGVDNIRAYLPRVVTAGINLGL